LSSLIRRSRGHEVFFRTLGGHFGGQGRKTHIIYGGGLRLEEACRLKAQHINCARMQIRVEQGKSSSPQNLLALPPQSH
jgi:hypothetical protein